VLVLLVLKSYAGSASAPLTVLKEDFESYATSEAMSVAWPGGMGRLETAPPGGGKAALHDGSHMNRRGGFTVGPDARYNVVLEADFYDFATNNDRRVTISLRRKTGETFEMGFRSGAIYATRVVGFASRTNWIPFKKTQRAVEGWHRFKAVLSLTNVVTTLDLKADGKVDLVTEIPFTQGPGQFTHLRFGGSSTPSLGGPVLVDNIELTLVPLEPLPMVAAAPAAPLSAKAPPKGPAPITDYPAVAWWIVMGLAIIIGLLASLLVMIKRSWPASSTALAPSAKARELPAGALESAAPEVWRERAVNAEALAAQQAQLLRDKVGPELAEFAKQALVQGLYTQRNALLETQCNAQQALIELEHRLAELHLPVPDRIRAYETRIAELEKELETRGEEMRELTQATLLLVRQKLEQERERTPRFN
jgi:hypothetical protein